MNDELTLVASSPPRANRRRRILIYRPTFGTLGALLAGYVAYRVLLYSAYFSPLRHVPGPPTETLLYGNLPSILREPPGLLHTEWSDKYGGVVKYTGMLGEDRLVFTDPVALNHILGQAYAFPKPAAIRGSLARILGKGVLFAEGEVGDAEPASQATDGVRPSLCRSRPSSTAQDYEPCILTIPSP